MTFLLIITRLKDEDGSKDFDGGGHA